MHAGKLYLMDWIEGRNEGMIGECHAAEGLSSGFAEGLGPSQKSPSFDFFQSVSFCHVCTLCGPCAPPGGRVGRSVLVLAFTCLRQLANAGSLEQVVIDLVALDDRYEMKCVNPVPLLNVE